MDAPGTNYLKYALYAGRHLRTLRVIDMSQSSATQQLRMHRLAGQGLQVLPGVRKLQMPGLHHRETDHQRVKVRNTKDS